MNGIHDLGGMHGMGPIVPDTLEKGYHAPWEARVHAMSSAMGATGKLRLGLRPPIEAIPPADYLRMSYYEKWLTALIERMVASNLVTRDEIENGRPEKASANTPLAVSAQDAVAGLFRIPPVRRDLPIEPRFKVGQSVRALNINPVTHTRLPRYARGKSGTIDRGQGIFVFMESSALGLGEKPQHVYSVRFSARELWGKQAAPQDAVYLDLYEDYLEPA
jgi:nitrile hydratase